MQSFRHSLQRTAQLWVQVYSVKFGFFVCSVFFLKKHYFLKSHTYTFLVALNSSGNWRRIKQRAMTNTGTFGLWKYLRYIIFIIFKMYI